MTLSANAVVFLALAAAVGLALGGLYSSCAFRYVNKLSLVSPLRPVCHHCGRTLALWESIPLIGFMLLGGRCRTCDRVIGLRYPLTEIISALWAVALAFKFGPTPVWLVFMFFGGVFIVASLIDFETYILPDRLTLPGIILAFLSAWLVLGMDWRVSVAGSLLGGGSFLLLQRLYRLVRKGEEGIGTGDVKLMFLIGALMGPSALPLVISIASLSALAASLFYILRPGNSGLKTRIPFGPFLCFGAMLSILYGIDFWRWYMT